jgi:hypothetical protein
MTIITTDHEDGKTIDGRFEIFFKRFKLNSILRKINATKEKGVLASVLVSFILKLVFTQKNFYATFTSKREELPFGKDAVYRMLNEPSVRWEALVPNLAMEVIPVIDNLTSSERRCALIIDDTPYCRDRSKKVELLSRFKDHSENR